MFWPDQAAEAAEAAAQECSEIEADDNEIMEQIQGDLATLRSEIETLEAEYASILDTLSEKQGEVASLEAQLTDMEIEAVDSFDLTEMYEDRLRRIVNYADETCWNKRFPIRAAFFDENNDIKLPENNDYRGRARWHIVRQRVDMCGRDVIPDDKSHIKQLFVDDPPEGYEVNDIFMRLRNALPENSRRQELMDEIRIIK